MKKWYIDVTLMRGIGEHHGMVRLDIEQALQVLRYIEEYYYNCVEVPVEDILMEELLGCLENLKDTYEHMHHMEQSGLD